MKGLREEMNHKKIIAIIFLISGILLTGYTFSEEAPYLLCNVQFVTTPSGWTNPQKLYFPSNRQGKCVMTKNNIYLLILPVLLFLSIKIFSKVLMDVMKDLAFNLISTAIFLIGVPLMTCLGLIS